jgi:hypothetical protein
MRPAPLTRPGGKPKILTNVARLSRGPWRLAAAYDASGLVASQAFFGLWLTDAGFPIEALEAVLNGPLANAFLTERASNQHFTNELLKRLPVPKHQNLNEITQTVLRFRNARAAAQAHGLKRPGADEHLSRLLVELDAEVLKAYELPPRLERRLLEFFRGCEHER